MLRHSRFILAVLFAAAALGAAKPKPKAPEGITSQQADAILGELREIRLLLEKQLRAAGPMQAPAPPPPPANVDLKFAADVQMLGDKNAPLTMVEYIDFQCSFCKRFDETTFAEIRKNFIDTGKLRYVSRNYPLDFHPFAMKGAVAAGCAAEQGKFWPMREALVTNAANLAPGAVLGYAKAAGLDEAAFKTCFESAKYDQSIQASLREGTNAGVQGTPSFVIGKSTPDGVTGALVVGALPYAVFETEFRKLQ